MGCPNPFIGRVQSAHLPVRRKAASATLDNVYALKHCQAAAKPDGMALDLCDLRTVNTDGLAFCMLDKVQIVPLDSGCTTWVRPPTSSKGAMPP